MARLQRRLPSPVSGAVHVRACVCVRLCVWGGEGGEVVGTGDGEYVQGRVMMMAGEGIWASRSRQGKCLTYDPCIDNTVIMLFIAVQCVRLDFWLYLSLLF